MNAELTYRPYNEFEPFPRAALDHSIAVRFEEIVRRFPDKVAISSREHTWTYARLNAEANKIAQHIRAAKVPPKAPILLNLRHDAPAIAGVIGILKTEHFYCALDPALTHERRETIVNTLRPALLICNQANLDRSSELAGDSIGLLNLDAAPQVSDNRIFSSADLPDGLAYVFFTSGSTGEPKGVMDCHRNVLHNILRYTNSLHINNNDRLSLLQSLSFSGSVSSLFCALLNGATVYPFDFRQASAAALADWIATQQLTMLHSVPSIFRLIAAQGQRFPDLRVIRLEGDQASPADAALFQKHFSAPCLLVNGLGATECGIVRQFFLAKDTPLAANSLPIGYPVEDMEVSVIGDDGRIVPSGEIGEIAVRSRYLALGYWERPDLTDQAFSPDMNDPRSRLYRTGDLGRMDPGGCLEYLGRKDSRAKIHGNWVDLAALEAMVLAIDGVQEAVAVVREDRTQNKQIVLYYAAADHPKYHPDAIKALMGHHLQPSPRPSRLVRLDRLPLTANGKIDRSALPNPNRERQLETAATPAHTAVESVLVGIWEEILELEPIGTEDSFLDLGGDSLQMMSMLNRVLQSYGISIPIPDFFPLPTISNLAAMLYERAGRVL
ncbi:MAG TPA: non-ribosomal peptide synthetase [Candidatus Binatia bacterium]